MVNKYALKLRVTDEYLKDLEVMGLIIEGENIMAICVECEYYKADYNCMNDDLPISDFVDGSRDCYENNPHGKCKGFKTKPQPESIYESKEDEELAETRSKEDVLSLISNE